MRFTACGASEGKGGDEVRFELARRWVEGEGERARARDEGT